MAKTAVITGASKGLGLEMVRQLAAKGMRVFALVRSSNAELKAVSGDVTIVEGVDVTRADLAAVLAKSALGGIKIDLLINNAGGYGGPAATDPMAMFAQQSLANIEMATMRDAFALNTIGPLAITKALLPQIATEGGKVVIISSMLGSISDTSGGSYAYRAAKASVNMVGRCLAMDLKPKGIAVSLVHPGMVRTSFAGDHANVPPQMLKSMREVEPSVRGVLDAVDFTNLENTGCFLHGNYGEGIKPCPW
jgi:tubulin alpha